jgi:hypothetical protein
MTRQLSALAMIVLALAACGGDDKKAAGGSSSGSGTGAATIAPLAVPPLGVDAIKRFNYVYGPAQKEYEKVVAAYKATPRDWGAIRAAAEATLAKDADHLDARWALGEALASTGEPAKAAEALLTALAGDWLRWGPGLAQDPDLAGFVGTPHGKALLDASAQLDAAVTQALATAPLVLGRRSGWKLPKPGTGYAATRGEVYAYDVAAKRFLRVTHTDHTVAAVLRGPSGELLLAGFTHAQVTDPTKITGTGRAAGTAAAPLLTRSWVSAWSPKDRTVTAKQAAIGKARFVWAGYGPGEQVLVTTATASGRWSPGDFTTHVVDRGAGKLTRTKDVAIEGPRIQMTLDDVVIVRDGGWPTTLEPPVQDALAAVVPADERGMPELASVALSPNGARLAFATETDPCADQDAAAQPSLYVADAKTGAYKHVLTAASRFGLQWLDDDRLLYEDGSGGLRVYDAAARREVGKLGERAGLALHALAPSAAPLCQSEPPADDPTAPDEDELPPEEPGPASDPAAPAATP